MQRFPFVLLAVLLLTACTPSLKTARSTGKRGAHCPALVDGKVRFAVAAPGATLVTIAGSFNSWNPDLTELAPGRDGVWTVSLELAPGSRVTYKFLIDGHWLPDPANPDAEEDGFGGYNSVCTVPGKGAGK